MSDYFGKEVFKLGFGLMRLPHLEDGSNDMPQICEMVDRFMAAGGTYFDTAFVYDDGKSEEAVKLALVDRYPRESFTVATKVNCSMGNPTAEETKRQLEISLERTGAGYFDYYLLHAINPLNVNTYEEYGIWDYVKEQKEKGILRYVGFSFHGGPELLEQVLTAHPEVDFIQLQINYADWENPEVTSRANYEVARKHGVSITVMEPVKGGALADPIPSVKEIFDEADPNASYASWAIRYVASLDGIITVLSGMSTLAQMEDNLSYMKDFQPLSEAEQEVIRRVQTALIDDQSIPCTACNYCTGGCPMDIPIPKIFRVKNNYEVSQNLEEAKVWYGRHTAGAGKASDCISCGQCETQCPQHLSIIELLQECAETLE